MGNDADDRGSEGAAEVVRTQHALTDSPIETLDDYVSRGGGRGLAVALGSDPGVVIDQIEAAGVRGRGGAGFPTGLKWRGLASASVTDPVTVVVNGAEGEPGTLKDRALLRSNPYAPIEGALIAAHCMHADRIVIGTKIGYQREVAAIERAIGEIEAAGWTTDLEIRIVLGPDHYLFGEETALLEVIEGEDPLPRHIPPYLYGLFTNAPQLGWSAGIDDGGGADAGSNPALVNNVETYAHVALVLERGADWYRSMGTHETPGPTIVTITGDVERAIVAEVEPGAPLSALIDDLAGGVRCGRSVRAVLSGVSNPVLAGDAVATPVSHEALGAAGAGLGSAGFVVYDESRNMIDVAYQVSRFLHVESCGQCNPCKTGTQAITVALEQLVLDGALSDRSSTAMERSLRTVTDGSRCFLPAQEQRLIASLLERFPDDLEARLAGTAGDPDVVLPKLIDIVDGVAVTDPDHRRKLPDWTYGEQPVRLGPRVIRSTD